jgi:hypothetical protein
VPAFTYKSALAAAIGGDATIQQQCISSAVKLAQSVYNEAPQQTVTANTTAASTALASVSPAFTIGSVGGVVSASGVIVGTLLNAFSGTTGTLSANANATQTGVTLTVTSPKHAARAALAVKILNNPQSYAEELALIAVMDPTIFAAGAATDAQIDTALSAAWNALAGA